MYVTNLELTNNSQKMVVCPLLVWDKVTQGCLTDSECMGFLHAVINISQKNQWEEGCISDNKTGIPTVYGLLNKQVEAHTNF